MKTLEERLNRKCDDFDLSDETFKRKSKTHDWRNHVPDEIINNWGILNDDERFLIALVAEMSADREEWD